ncbi:MAG TPA: flagellar biosynthetic protein FliR [Gemmatimonadaceae bacterium]|nr:flagellar biosynthetic protein FliR [Gemmatimonadaceae bacterium]
MPIDLFAAGSPQTLVLFAARVGGLVLVAPIFSAKAIPTTVKTAIIVLLTILLQPMVFAQMTAIPQVTPETFVGETLVGFALGLGAALLIGAANVAGDLMGMQIGLSGAAILDPINNSSENVLGTFGNLFALAMLLAVDAHLVMIDALARSVHLIPIGSGLHPEGLRAMVRGASLLFGLGLQFAAPVIAATIIANTALAILSRAAPQLNILSVAFPVQIGIGLVALSASIPFVGAFYRGWSGVYANGLDRVFTALSRGAP